MFPLSLWYRPSVPSKVAQSDIMSLLLRMMMITTRRMRRILMIQGMLIPADRQDSWVTSG